MTKKIVSIALLAVMSLGFGAVAFAGTDTTGPCKICSCQKYEQGLKQKGECKCGHSKGIHESRPR